MAICGGQCGYSRGAWSGCPLLVILRFTSVLCGHSLASLLRSAKAPVWSGYAVVKCIGAIGLMRPRILVIHREQSTPTQASLIALLVRSIYAPRREAMFDIWEQDVDPKPVPFRCRCRGMGDSKTGNANSKKDGKSDSGAVAGGRVTTAARCTSKTREFEKRTVSKTQACLFGREGNSIKLLRNQMVICHSCTALWRRPDPVSGA